MFELVSISISAITLASVVFTGRLLSRQTKVAQMHSARTLQLELFRIAYESPSLRSVHGLRSMQEQDFRTKTYRNMWFMYYQMNYLTGAVSESAVRAFVSAELFAEQSGLDWWAQARDFLKAEAASDRKLLKFMSIVDQEYLSIERPVEQVHQPKNIE